MNIPPGADTTDSTDVTIVGVIGDFRNGGLAAPPEPQMIALNSQHPLVAYGFRDIVVRTAADPHLQRRHELAIRAAVGASAQNILWLVLKEGLRMAAIGAFVGIVGAVAAQKLISGLLFGVSAIDPLAFASPALFLVTVVMIACSLPAWRASRVDPSSALRAE